jgi:putative nucleotidyltransferase with HDIG domain
LAGQLSIGMENARLYEELMFKTTTLENNLEVISVMRELDRTILSTLEPAQIFEVSAQLVDRIIPCDRVTVVLIDRERGGFIYKAGWGIEFEKGAFVKFEDTNATEVVRTKRPIVRLNIAGEKNLLPLDKSFLEQGFLSDIRVPLIIKGEVYGLLNVGSRRRAGFTQEHISAAADIGTQVSVALSNATLVTELKDLYFNTVKSLSEAIDAKSEWTRGHSDRVTDIAMSTGEELGLEKEDMENLRFAAMLHDIGKIGTYEYILDKKEPLTEAEQKVIKDHPVRGAEIIGDIKQFKDVTPGVRHHHERYDGGGYPDGLSGKEIPLFARIINVADSFDAMTADRPYRKGLSREKGIEEVKKNSGIQFDPEIVAAFLRKIERVQTPC